MFSRSLTLFLFITSMTVSSLGWAQSVTLNPTSDDEEDSKTTTAIVKPYEYEREAYGYDPSGIDYKENQAEDFQVIFITSAPFTALASFGITGFVSMISNGNFGVGGNYFLPFLGGILVGSTTIACVSVLTNKYPPPPSPFVTQSGPSLPPLAFRMDLLSAKF
ncbi:MAG TPA: hypothetical protein VIJ93_01795 [bacterium]